MHAQGVVHRDMKLENVLLGALPSSGPRSTDIPIKVTDFGLASYRSEAEETREAYLGSKVGTIVYMAPEVVALDRRTSRSPPAKYGSPCDVWAVGVMAFLLRTGCHPFARPEEA